MYFNKKNWISMFVFGIFTVSVIMTILAVVYPMG